MSSRFLPRLALLLPLSLLASLAAPAPRAQEPAPAPAAAQELPPARDVLERFARETKLAEVLAKTTSAYVAGRAEIPSLGIGGRFERWAAKPDKSLVRIQLETVGEVLSGYDGKTGWTIHPMLGAVVLDGVELLQARQQAEYDASLRDPKGYVSIETTGRKPFEGVECWELRFVARPDEGMDAAATRAARTSYEYYAVESGLLLGQRSTSATPMGEMDVVVKYSKYKEIGGVNQATVLVQEAAGSQLRVTLERVEYDQVKDERFALPERIAAVLRERAAAAGAKPQPEPEPEPKPEPKPDDGGGAPR